MSVQVSWLSQEDTLPVSCRLATGSPVMSGYYGVRRSFLSDSDFHSTKFANDTCAPGVSKPFPCEPSAGQSHPALLDSYFPEPFGDPRPPALTPNPGSLFSAPPLPPLLPPPFSGDPAHLALVSMWVSPGGGGRSARALKPGLACPGAR